MILVSASFRTTFFGMPIPLPVMTLFIRERGSCVRVRVECKQVFARKPILSATELTHHLGTALIDHLAQLVRREKGQRRKGALPAARTGVTERNIEARIDLFVLTAMKNSRDNVFDPHLVEQRAERRRFLDPPLDAIDRFRAGVRKALHDDSARGGNAVAPVE